MLDKNLFREEKGNNPEIIRESQRQRFANVEIIDEVIDHDRKWRQGQFEVEQLRTDVNRINKQVAKLKTEIKDKIRRSEEIKDSIAKKDIEVKKAHAALNSKLELVGNLVHDSVPASNDEVEKLREEFNGINKQVAKLETEIKDKIKSSEEKQHSITKKNIEVEEVLAALHTKLELVGNLVHDSVPVSNDEANNVVVRTWGEERKEPKLKNHVELVELLGIADLERGEMVAGKGGVFMIDDGVELIQALVNFAINFLRKKGFEKSSQPPMFMTKDIMRKCTKSAEELYTVTGDGDDKNLIGTAEQPLCAYHIKDWIHPAKLPLRYAGYSTCFRKEDSCDNLGIFNGNQFQKVEQFSITSPNGNDSWNMHEEMTKNLEEFYKMLKLPYQTVSVVSGALDEAAAKTYHLEAWFPASINYRKLASCSNYTDYKSRKLETRFGHKGNEKTKQYCHILNSTLTDVQRTMCCILETYQREGGVEVPEVLQPYMSGKEFIQFKDAKGKKLKAIPENKIGESTLDINLFREETGNNPEIIRESQRRRGANVEIVDGIIHLDKEWQCQIELEQLHINCFNGQVAKLKIDGEDAKKAIEVEEARKALYKKMELIGNIVHDSVPVSNDEANNVVVRTWGEKRMEPKLKNHVELVELLGIVALKEGADVAGGRGYYLIGDGVRLNQALIKFGLDFMKNRGSQLLATPYTMKKDIMGKCAQLAQFDEELYKVSGDEDDKYLIATSEQTLCAYHMNTVIHPTQLPLRCVGYSTCFRKEAGSHGRDTAGIFRVHQFEKIEQFCITSPNGNDSWDMLEEMINNSEEFYQLLKLPYQVVSIVSGALNDAAAKKYDFEAWFPASKTYRELVSCSNCTDYQSRKLNIRYGDDEGSKQYCHLLNSTLTATERTICCILENYQKEGGVEVPEVLQPYMHGTEFMPFLKTKGKKSN